MESDYSDPDHEGFRHGDEPADSRLGDFDVFGGTTGDRQRLADRDPETLAGANQDLVDALEDDESETGQ